MPSNRRSIVLMLIIAVAVGAGEVRVDDADSGVGLVTDLRLSASSAADAAAWAEYAKGLFMLGEDGASVAAAAPYFARALGHLPDSPYLLRALIGPRLIAKEWTQCLADLAPVVEAHPDAVMPNLIYADLLTEIGKHVEAIAQLRRTLAATTWQDGRVVRELAKKLWLNKQPGDAVELYAQAMRQEALRADVGLSCAAAGMWHAYAEVLLAEEDAAKPTWAERRAARSWRQRARRQALALADRMVKESEASIEDRLSAGNLLADLGEWKRLDAYWERLSPVMTAAPSRHAWSSLRLRLVEQSGDVVQQRAFYHELLSDIQLPPYLLSAAGEFYLKQERIPEAIGVFERLQAMDTANIGLRLQLAHLYLLAHEYQQGLRMLEPIEPMPPQGALLSAHLWRRLGDLERAYAEMKKAGEAALARKDDAFFTTSYYFNLATICETTGRVDEAIDISRIAYQREPANPACANFLGYLLADHQRELPYAKELIDQALAKEPASIAYLDSRAWVLFRLRELHEALLVMADLLQRGAAQKDEEGVISDHAGDIYAANGYPLLARFYWLMALDETGPGAAARIRAKMAP